MSARICRSRTDGGFGGEGQEAGAKCSNEAHVTNLPTPLGKLLCWLGMHEFRVLNKSFEFRTNEGVERVECTRCGLRMTRKA